MKKGGVIYCRVSTPKQSQEGESFDVQEENCRIIGKTKKCRIMPNNKIYKDSCSGRKNHRPAFDEMMHYIKKNHKKIDYVIIRDIDRLTRGGSFSYEKIKRELAKYDIELIDSYGLIQPSINTLEHLGFEYPWSKFSNSEMTEKIKADMGKDEVRNILTRLIGQSIRLVQEGYQVRHPWDGYVNKKIYVKGKKKTIQEEDPKRAKYFKKMFLLRASGKYSDQEIVDKLNAMGFTTKTRKKWNKTHEKIIGSTGGISLTIKQLQRVIKKPIYCGVICQKWTFYKPIKAKYNGLISIEMFNQANRGKVFIKENSDNSLEILYDYSPMKIVQQRNKNNPLFPFKNVINCPFCNKPFLGSSPQGKSGQKFPIYHCSRNHKYFGINKKEFENNVKTFIKNLEFKKDFFDSIEPVLINKYRERQKEITQSSLEISSNLAELKTEKEQAIEILLNTDSSVARKAIEKKVDELEEKITNAQQQRQNIELNEDDIKDFIDYAKFLMEHLEKLLLNETNIHTQQALFGLVFEELPSYQDILNGTPKLSLILQQKETSQNEKSQKVALRGIEPLLHD